MNEFDADVAREALPVQTRAYRRDRGTHRRLQANGPPATRRLGGCTPARAPPAACPTPCPSRAPGKPMAGAAAPGLSPQRPRIPAEEEILSNVQRGPLVKLTIGRSASRIDVTDLGERSARTDTSRTRAVARRSAAEPQRRIYGPRHAKRFDRLKRIAKAADLYRRETGVSALVLAFPSSPLTTAL